MSVHMDASFAEQRDGGREGGVESGGVGSGREVKNE